MYCLTRKKKPAVKKKIIIVDDDPGIQDIFRLIFKNSQYDVTVFGTGEPLLNNQFEKPDVFILDKQISGSDGIEICRFLKAQDNTSQVPVIMLSATPHIKSLSEEAGADGFLEKPFKLSALREMVARCVGA